MHALGPMGLKRPEGQRERRNTNMKSPSVKSKLFRGGFKGAHTMPEIHYRG